MNNIKYRINHDLGLLQPDKCMVTPSFSDIFFYESEFTRLSSLLDEPELYIRADLQ